MLAERVAFLTLDEALALHERLIARFVGTAGLRDAGLLESALYRPRTGYYRDLSEMAHDFVVGLLDRKECDFENLPWVRSAVQRL